MRRGRRGVTVSVGLALLVAVAVPVRSDPAAPLWGEAKTVGTWSNQDEDPYIYLGHASTQGAVGFVSIGEGYDQLSCKVSWFRNGKWSAATPLSVRAPAGFGFNRIHLGRPPFSVAHDGSAVIAAAAPKQRTRNQGPVIARTFDPSTSEWSPELQLFDPASVYIGEPAVAAAPGGAFIVARNDDLGLRTIVFDGVTQQGPTVHAAPDDGAYVQSVAMNGDGDAVLVWQQGSGTSRGVYASVWHAGSWTAPSTLPGTTGSEWTQTLVADTGADFLAVVRDGAKKTIHAAFLDGSTGQWSNPVTLDTDAGIPAASITDGRRALVAYERHSPLAEDQSGLWATTFDGSTWSDPRLLVADLAPLRPDIGDGDPASRPIVSGSPAVSLQADGKGWIAYARGPDGDGEGADLYAIRYDGAAFLEPRMLFPSSATPYRSVVLGVFATGGDTGLAIADQMTRKQVGFSDLDGPTYRDTHAFRSVTSPYEQVRADPAITKLTGAPNLAPGNTATLIGANFGKSGHVYVEGAPAHVVAWSNKRVAFRVPPVAREVGVQVVTSEGLSTDATLSPVPPVATAVQRVGKKLKGGKALWEIRGTAFGSRAHVPGSCSVLAGGTQIEDADIVGWADEKIRFRMAPPAATQDVAVQTSVGTSAAVQIVVR